jgi:hypothetical protein
VSCTPWRSVFKIVYGQTILQFLVNLAGVL